MNSNKTKSKKSILAAVIGFLAGAGGAPGATAQSDSEPQARSMAMLEEVIVTAQRRSETVQDVALAVSAVTGEKLIAEGVRSVVDMSSQAPSLQVTGGGGGNTQVFMRGVGSTNTTEVGDPAVGVHVDGIYIPRTTGLNGLFYDINRIEVVRGPQGTLYGRNATAGAINIITNRPEEEFAGSAAVEFGNYNTQITTGMLNLPLSETLALRGAFQTARHDGYLETVGSAGPSAKGRDRNDQDDASARLQLLYEPSNTFTLLLRGDYRHSGGAGLHDPAFPLETGDPFTSLAQHDTFRDDTFVSGSIEAEYDLGFATLTYLGGLHQNDLNSAIENLSTHRLNYADNEQDSWSHELRLGNDGEKLKWVVGLFTFSEDISTNFRVTLPNDTFLTFIQEPTQSDSTAIFSQATWSLTDRFRVTGGLRYTEDEKSRQGHTYITDSNNAILSTVATNIADEKWNSTDWKIGVDYDIDMDSMVYAQVATAYKAGGYFDGLPPNSYDPEEILAYEIGSKNMLLDNRLRVNVAVFYSDYSDLQVSAVENLFGQNALVTRNAGEASIYGIELETDYQIALNGSLDLTVAWLQAEYDEFVLESGDPFINNDINANVERCYSADYSQPGPRAGDFSGCTMARTPEWAINLGYSHNWELSNGASLVGRFQTHYESEKDLESHGFEPNKQDAFTKTDISLTYHSPNERWSIMAYVRNIEDDEVATNSNSDARGGDSTSGTRFYAPPRLYGVRLSANFD